MSGMQVKEDSTAYTLCPALSRGSEELTLLRCSRSASFSKATALRLSLAL